MNLNLALVVKKAFAKMHYGRKANKPLALKGVTQIRRYIMRFVKVTKFQHAPAYLMMLQFYKLDKLIGVGRGGGAGPQ